MADGKFIAYYRVSTGRQGASGLGLDAQKQAVLRHLNGGRWELLGEFVEVESGKRNDRPKLAEAIRECKRQKATLIIAKIDRLARNVAFIANLLDSGVEFVAADFPTANKMMIQMLSVFAEFEREQISKRTKEALAAAKARGVKLGTKDQAAMSKAGAAALKQKADAFAEEMRPLIEGFKAQGITSTLSIASELNRRNVASRSGGRWHAGTVGRLLKRLA